MADVDHTASGAGAGSHKRGISASDRTDRPKRLDHVIAAGGSTKPDDDSSTAMGDIPDFSVDRGGPNHGAVDERGRQLDHTLQPSADAVWLREFDHGSFGNPAADQWLPVFADAPLAHDSAALSAANASASPRGAYQPPQQPFFAAIVAAGLHSLRQALISMRRLWLQWGSAVHVHPTACFSLSTRFGASAPGGVRVGADTLVAYQTLLDARDFATGTDNPIRIGERCFIGCGSIIMPGVSIGDETIVTPGAVVFANVPPGSIVAGNPARVVQSKIRAGRFGRLLGTDADSQQICAQ